VADALEDDVGTAAARRRAELLDGVAAVEAHRLGAELLGELQAVVHAVHREDVRGAEEVGRLHGEQANGPGAENGDGVARADPAALGADVARRKDVAEEERVLVAHVRGHLVTQIVGERHPDALGLAPPHTWPKRPPKTARPVVAHCEGSRRRHHSQRPHETENGTITRSPRARPCTPGPASSTVPMNSWPMIAPVWTSAPPPRPWYWWRSEPQTALVVIRTTMSVESTSRGSATSSARTSPTPWKVIAFMVVSSPSARARRARGRRRRAC
jgi:hypothetical protein